MSDLTNFGFPSGPMIIDTSIWHHDMNANCHDLLKLRLLTGCEDLVRIDSDVDLSSPHHYRIDGQIIGEPAGEDGWLQYNDDGKFGASQPLRWNDNTQTLQVGGDINIVDGYTYRIDGVPLLQLFGAAPPNGSVQYNSGGQFAGSSMFTYDPDLPMLNVGGFISSSGLGWSGQALPSSGPAVSMYYRTYDNRGFLDCEDWPHAQGDPALPLFITGNPVLINSWYRYGKQGNVFVGADSPTWGLGQIPFPESVYGYTEQDGQTYGYHVTIGMQNAIFLNLYSYIEPSRITFSAATVVWNEPDADDLRLAVIEAGAGDLGYNTGRLSFYTRDYFDGVQERMRITRSGNVGIWSQNPPSNPKNPQANLHVEGYGTIASPIALFRGLGGGSFSYVFIDSDYGGSYYPSGVVFLENGAYRGEIANSGYGGITIVSSQDNPNGIQFFTGATGAGNVVSGNVGTERMHIDDSGVTIHGGLSVEGQNGATIGTGGYIYYAQLFFHLDTGQWILQQSGSGTSLPGVFSFINQGNYLINISPAGNMNIGYFTGSPDPAFKLDVNGDVNITGRLFINGTQVLP